MRNTFKCLPLALCLFLFGCTKTITKAQYAQECEKTVNFHNTIPGQVYYQGSKNGYDYFRFEPFGLPHSARVKENNEIVLKRIPYTSDRNKWIVAYLIWASPTNIVILSTTTNQDSNGR